MLLQVEFSEKLLLSSMRSAHDLPQHCLYFFLVSGHTVFLATWLPASGQGLPLALIVLAGTEIAEGFAAASPLLAAAVDDLKWRQSPMLCSMSSMLFGTGLPSRFACAHNKSLAYRERSRAPLQPAR
jgi:hypothetical protein